MGDCRTGTCPTVRYEAPRPTYQQPEKSWCQSAACDAYAGKGTTTVYDGQTKPQYDKMAESFKFNGSKGSNEKGGVQDAYAEAIRTGKPLVVVMGKFDGNNPRNVVDQTQKNAKDDAVYLYVDPTTCKDEQLKAYAEQRLKGGHNASMTDVFEFTPGKDGGPPDMKKVHSWQGGDPSMVASFKDALSKTHDNMTANKDKFSKEPMGPTEIEQKQIADAKAKAVAEKAAADKAAADKAAADKAVADKAAADKAAADKAVADKAAADKAAAEKATAEKAAAEKAAAEKAAAEKTAAEKTAADLKAAEEKGRLAGRAEVKAETAKVVSDVIDLTVPIVPITRAGVQVGQKAVEFVAEHPKEAAIIAAPAIAIPVLARKEVVDFAVKNPDVAAKVVIAGAMPIIPVVTGGAKLARKAYDLLPEKPSWLP